jgi:hypothetical protein
MGADRAPVEAFISRRRLSRVEDEIADGGNGDDLKALIKRAVDEFVARATRRALLSSADDVQQPLTVSWAPV